MTTHYEAGTCTADKLIHSFNDAYYSSICYRAIRFVSFRDCCGQLVSTHPYLLNISLRFVISHLNMIHRIRVTRSQTSFTLYQGYTALPNESFSCVIFHNLK